LPDPEVFTPEEVAAFADGRRLTVEGRLSERQQEEWTEAQQDPLEAWEAWRAVRPATPAIDHPLIMLFATPVLDQVVDEHAGTPQTALELVRALSQAIGGLEAARKVLTQLPSPTLLSGFLLASFARLFRLEATPLWHLLTSPEVTQLLSQLEEGMRAVTPISQVENAWGPPHDPREPVWYRGARRLVTVICPDYPPSKGTGATLYRALVAGLDWHGQDLGAGTLDQKADRVRWALPQQLHIVR
jgi:hypothetical protein